MIAPFVDTPRPAGRPSSCSPGINMSPSPTLAFLESISLDRAELKFCERFDEQSRIWNFEKHSHPYFELILFLEGKANIHAGDDSLDISLFDVLIYPPGLLHTEQLELGRRQEIICLRADLGSCARFDHAIKLPTLGEPSARFSHPSTRSSRGSITSRRRS